MFRLRSAFAKALCSVCLMVALIASIVVVPAYAGTVGQLSGRVVDSKTHLPIAGVKVTAVSPTERGTAVTDAGGRFTILGLDPDTYAISFEKTGLQSELDYGQTVIPDQTTTVEVQMHPYLTTIGQITGRSTSSAFQPGQAITSYTVNSTDIVQTQGSALNNNATQLFASLPGVTNAGQNNGVPVIRGGRSDEIGVSVNGIPETNSYTGTFGAAQLQDMSYRFDVLDTVPTLALQSLTLSPGFADASYGNTGTGNLNLVFKKGAYPSFYDFDGGIGGGDRYHATSFDYGTAPPNGRWQAYFMFHDDNTYPNWAPGLAAANAQVIGYPGNQFQRQYVVNLDYNWGTDNKYGLEFQSYDDDAALQADYGINNAQTCFFSCSQSEIGNSVSGSTGNCGFHAPGLPPLDNTANDAISPITGGYLQKNCLALLTLFPGQTSYDESAAQAGMSTYSEQYPHHNYSLTFHDKLTQSTYMKASLFRAGGTQTDNRLGGGADAYVVTQGGNTTGATLDFTTQLGDKNLVKYGAYTAYEAPTINQYLPDWGLEIVAFGALAEFYDFVPKNYGDYGCPLTSALTYNGYTNPANYCGYLESQTGQSLVQIPGKSLATAITPHYTSGYVTDEFKPTDKITVVAGARIDTADYNYPKPGVDLATCTSLYAPLTVTPPTDAQGNYVSIVPGKTCPTETFANINSAIHPSILQPRLGISDKLGNDDAVKLDYGRSVSWVPESIINPQLVSPGSFSNLANVPSYYNPATYCLGGDYFSGVDVTADPRCNPANFNTAFQPGKSVGFYSYYNPFPCTGGLKNGKCPTNPNYPLPPPGQVNPSGAPACGNAALGSAGLVPCVSEQEQLFWDYQDDYQGFGPYGADTRSAPLQPVPPAQFGNYDIGYAHQFSAGIGRGLLQSLTQGIGFSLTSWKRVGQGLSLNENLPITNGGSVAKGPQNSLLGYTAYETANGLDLANGLEARLTRARPYGLSMQFSATYQKVLTNAYASPSNEYANLGGLNAPGTTGANASLFLNLLYPQAYISPLTTNTTLSFKTRGGWRFGTNIAWAKGYPIGAGQYTAQFVDSAPELIPNTNVVNGGNATRYFDPFSPGTVQAPRIAANDGGSEGRYAWQSLTSPQSFTSLQIEKFITPKMSIGLNINNLFDQIDSGATLNPNYQPVANGVAGPKSGTTTNNLVAGQGYSFLPSGSGPFQDLPQNQGLTFYLYVSFKK